MLDYEIHYTGSSGNSNIIYGGGYKFLVDIGKPFKHVEKLGLSDVDVLLISHKHSDHINMATYKRIMRDFPNITVITNKEVAKFIKEKGCDVEPDIIIESGLAIDIDNVRINFIENLHGVDTQGFIFEEANELMLYATDLSTTAFYDDWLDKEKRKLNYCLLENNYDINKLIELEKQHTGYDIFTAQGRHLEKTDYFKFIHKYSEPHCKHEQLHQSSTMY